MVLCYHAVSEHWPSALAVKPEELERQVSFLLSRGWVPATFSDAVLDPPSHRTFAVTFDDAFLSVRRLGLPVLSALGVPATVFAPTAFMEQRQPLSWPGIEEWSEGRYRDELQSMNWDDLGALVAAGWEVGSHGETHAHLGQISDAELRRELRGSRMRCNARLGVECQGLAYPYGYADARIARVAREAGYRTAAVLEQWRAPRTADPLLYPRTGIYRVDAMWRFRLKLSSVQHVLRATRTDTVERRP